MRIRPVVVLCVLLHCVGLALGALGIGPQHIRFGSTAQTYDALTLWLHILEANLMLALAALVGGLLIAPPFIASTLTGCSMGALISRLIREGGMSVLAAMTPHMVLEDLGFLVACIFGAEVAVSTVKRLRARSIAPALARGFTLSAATLVLSSVIEVYLFPLLLLFLWLLTP